MANNLSNLDGQQVLRAAFDDDMGKIGIVDFSALIPASYDHVTLTYVTSGNGVGEIETVTYREGGPSGTVVASLALTYDASDNLETITRS